MYLLDTDSLSHFHAGHARITQRVRAVDTIEIGTTIVTHVEILRARFENLLKASDADQLLLAQQRLDRSEALLDEITTVRFDDAAAEEFERLRRVRRLKSIGRADLLISCITLAHDATLVTRNLRHFREVPNLRSVNWVD